MTQACVISASMAYDTIMVFDDSFRNHILPDKVHMLNVAFLVSTMRVEFGGCAGNIAYNLKLLGGEPRICAGVGKDSQRYLTHLYQYEIDTSGLAHYEETFTAQAFITTDRDDNQITAFHPGAMSHAVPPLKADGATLALVGPASKETMQAHMAELRRAGIPTLFDLGQAMPLFDGEELKAMIAKADYLAANDYEAEVITRRTGMDFDQLATQVKALVVTHGGKGSSIYADGEVHCIEPVTVAEPVDPTGCGDAYRAGLLFGISTGMDWLATGRLASVLGAVKVASHGTQNHTFSRESISKLYAKTYGDALPWPA